MSVSRHLALIVEDEAELADIFARALAKAGFVSEITMDGDTALSWLSSTKPDLVLLDLALPGTQGEDILDHIRTDPRLANTKVIVATAYGELAEPLKEKADVVLIKPVGFTQLRELAARLRLGEPSEEEGAE